MPKIAVFDIDTFDRNELDSLSHEDLLQLATTFEMVPSDTEKKAFVVDAGDFCDDLNNQTFNPDGYWTYFIPDTVDTPCKAIADLPKFYLTYHDDRDGKSYCIGDSDRQKIEALSMRLAHIPRQFSNIRIHELPNIGLYHATYIDGVNTATDTCHYPSLNDDNHELWLVFRYDTPKEQTSYVIYAKTMEELNEYVEYVKNIPGVTFRWTGIADGKAQYNALTKNAFTLTKEELLDKFNLPNERVYWVTYTWSSILAKVKYAVKCRSREEAVKIAHDVTSVSGCKYVKYGTTDKGISLSGCIKMTSKDYFDGNWTNTIED